MIFFSSDSHYSHARVIEYSNRPFSSVEEMDQTMINRWNSVVQPNDVVYFLGDFSFAKDTQYTINVFKQLKGSVHLIKGNHDKRMKGEVKKLFASCVDYMEIEVPDIDNPTGEQKIILCHYAFRTWNKSHFHSWDLHGHSHGSLPGNSQQLDVGVDCWDYTPCSYEQVKQRLKTLPPYQSQDHHVPRS